MLSDKTNCVLSCKLSFGIYRQTGTGYNKGNNSKKNITRNPVIRTVSINISTKNEYEKIKNHYTEPN